MAEMRMERHRWTAVACSLILGPQEPERGLDLLLVNKVKDSD